MYGGSGSRVLWFLLMCLPYSLTSCFSHVVEVRFYTPLFISISTFLYGVPIPVTLCLEFLSSDGASIPLILKARHRGKAFLPRWIQSGRRSKNSAYCYAEVRFPYIT